jgi:ribonuclease D
MTAKPQPVADQAAKAHTTLANLRAYGPQQFRKRGAHALANQLEWLLGHLPDVEGRLAASERRRRDFEAQAEGEFHELRLQVRAWQGYAAQLEDRWRELGLALENVLECKHDLVLASWWQWRRRRAERRNLAYWIEAAAEILHADGPTPPPVDA